MYKNGCYLFWRLKVAVASSKMTSKMVFFSILFFLSVAESSGFSRKMLYLNLDGKSNILLSWPILSAGIFVLVSVVLSLFLVFEHLLVYYQPEEQKFLIGIILMVPVYAVESMGISAIVHLYVFPAKPYQRGERCVRNVSVMDDYASLGAPPDVDEVADGGRFARMHISHSDDDQKRMSFHQSVRDVVFGGSEIMVDDVKFTVSHVVEPVERGIARFNETLHQISESVKQHEMRKRKAKDDTYLIPMHSWSKEFADAHDHISEGCFSDSGLPRKKTNMTTSMPKMSNSSTLHSTLEYGGSSKA
ncbi:hypothetical protein KSP40_PGU014145 [Platanthera guangdongensis]|uniref:Uncharacterized protein n=1 Tax=Platanthera guangdongensis TaxID=2320717 RepID=A0ABR2MQS4_9ASPA